MSYLSESLVALGSFVLLSPITVPTVADQPAIAPTTNSVCAGDSPQLPPSIALQPGLEPLVRWTLVHSPTFRQQCHVLAQVPSLTVNVRVGRRQAEDGPRALAVMRERANGGLDVEIELLNASNIAELLGHEFEHVIEQIDGVDLAVLAKRGEAKRLQNGAFETRRAIAAGQQVSGEVLDNAPDRLRRATGSVWRAIVRAVR